MKYKPYTVRFEPWILAELKAMARHERRSINDEILFILHEYITNFMKLHPDYLGTTVEDEISSGLETPQVHKEPDH